MNEATQSIDQLIEGLEDWRGPRLAELRGAIRSSDPSIFETWKWMGSPVWECTDGMLVVGDAHKDKIKLTFPHGAALDDPEKLFNNGFAGNARRAIDVCEADRLDLEALQALVRAAMAFSRDKKLKGKAGKTA
jgi:hypothetical protein